MKEEAMDEQSGFKENGGIIDGRFATFTSLLKRKEQNLEKWVMFVDLVKSFSSLPREARYLQCNSTTDYQTIS
jgi:hypothetical protein